MLDHTISAASSTDVQSIPTECGHETTEVRKRVQSNGIEVATIQCLTCGRALRNVNKAAAGPNLPPFDPDLATRYWDDWRERRARQREQETQEWFADHDAYLESDTWKGKAHARLQKDGYHCQAQLAGCSVRATQVHHLTYKHWKNEPLFDLISVCETCHDAITAMDREGRS